jgi:hypothetical protein
MSFVGIMLIEENAWAGLIPGQAFTSTERASPALHHLLHGDLPANRRYRDEDAVCQKFSRFA